MEQLLIAIVVGISMFFIGFFIGRIKRAALENVTRVGSIESKFFRIDNEENKYHVTMIVEQLEQVRNLCDRFLKTHIRKPSTPEDKLRVAKLIVAMRKAALNRAGKQLQEVEETNES